MLPSLLAVALTWTDVREIISVLPVQNSKKKNITKRAVHAKCVLKKLEAASSCFLSLFCFA